MAKSIPLIVEPHPNNYNGYPFITLIQYQNTKDYLTIVDNSTNKNIQAYVLDLCGPTKVNEEQIILIALEWFKQQSTYPISIEFSKLGINEETSKIFRTFSVDYTSRIIGPLPTYPMNHVKNVRRRKKKVLSPSLLSSIKLSIQ